MYGTSKYGLEQYAQENIEEQAGDYFVDLTKYVPAFLHEIEELQTLYEIEGKSLGLLWHHIRDLQKQFFITTATWGLVQWEKEYGMETNFSQSYEQRREILLAKKRGRGTTTKKMIQSVAKSFSGGEVEVIEKNEQSLFLIKFIGIKGIPRNLQNFIDALEEIKPAHLAYEFEYSYSIWDNLQTLTWNTLHEKTWDEVRRI